VKRGEEVLYTEPFTLEADRETVVNAAWSPRRYSNSLGMEFALVPKGTFWMGGRAGQPGEKEVTFPHDFYLGVYEVTQEEWEKVMGKPNEHGHFTRSGKDREAVKHIPDADLKRFPVDTVSWEDCQRFLVRLNEKLKEDGWAYRLPREAEWEYACRGGPLPNKEDYGYDYYTGTPTNTLLPERANFADSGLKRTCKVGSYPPNRLGLYDMHGNVFEVCEDSLTDGSGNPVVPLMGGGWLDPAGFCRVSGRGLGAPAARFNGSGLRVARVPLGKGEK
jgi:eukaryotic-like serine/threonine-protein kinase